jgi:hypothetical protein
MASSCTGETEIVSTSGVEKVTAEVEVQASGMTIEQENVKRRIEMDNMPGSVKHLYIISAYSGQVIVYSTVKGKVTSSGKRLTPYTVAAINGQYIYKEHEGFLVTLPDGTRKRTSEVLQDDGTYGSSIPYLYWWDVQDRYHQHYVSGGQIIHVSDKPIPGVKSVIINIE